MAIGESRDPAVKVQKTILPSCKINAITTIEEIGVASSSGEDAIVAADVEDGTAITTVDVEGLRIAVVVADVEVATEVAEGGTTMEVVEAVAMEEAVTNLFVMQQRLDLLASLSRRSTVYI